jgi:hypothetical protein
VRRSQDVCPVGTGFGALRNGYADATAAKIAGKYRNNAPRPGICPLARTLTTKDTKTTIATKGTKKLDRTKVTKSSLRVSGRLAAIDRSAFVTIVKEVLCSCGSVVFVGFVGARVTER